MSSSKIQMLGLEANLNWEQVGKNIEIDMPKVNPSKMPCDYAYTFKITEIN